jgi:hypothetical protein
MKISLLHEPLDYTLDPWMGLTPLLGQRPLEIDSYTVERAIRPVVLTRNSALGDYAHFAGQNLQSWCAGDFRGDKLRATSRL